MTPTRTSCTTRTTRHTPGTALETPTMPHTHTHTHTLVHTPAAHPAHPARPWRPAMALMLATSLLAACASVPPPTEQMAVSTAAVARAAQAGGTELAPGDMALARDKLAQANAALAQEKNDNARTLAEQAQVDAQVAEAKARSVKANKAAAELQESNRVLRQEIQRGAK